MSAMRVIEGESRRAGEFVVGDVIDERYELRRDLGRGAAGVVFEARHLFTGRSVALKVVLPDVARSSRAELHARLGREARAIAAVRHPGIVDVLDGGVARDGTPYIVMERLEGRTLEGMIAARGTLTREDTAGLALQLCNALTAAHKAGVVHRDLKPANVFIVRDLEGLERVKLVDFGIAQVKSGPAESKLTGIGALLGTPAYMAPEQLLAFDDVDHLADVYSLGVTLFECLTGRVPYEGAYHQVLMQAASPLAPPKVGSLCPDVGEAFGAVIDRAMQKDRAARFPTMLEFGRALRAALPGARARTALLGPPPVPKDGAAAVRPGALPIVMPSPASAAASAAAPASSPTPSSPRPAAPPEQRRAARAPYQTPVHIILPDGELDGHNEDISEGGMLVICRSECAANIKVDVRFAMPIEGKVITCAAVVRWTRAARPGDATGPRAIGLEFLDAPPEMRASISRYVALMSHPGKET